MEALAHRRRPARPDRRHARGVNWTVSFDGRAITIHRHSGMARLTVGKGEKRIPVARINAIQLKPARPVVNGYIEFSVAGGNESPRPVRESDLHAVHNENTVVFTPAEQAALLRDAIEAAY